MTEQNQPVNRLSPTAKVEPRAFVCSVAFHPPIKLDRKKGIEFARRLAECVDPENVQLSDSKWVFSQSWGETGNLQVTVEANTLQLGGAFPTVAPEWFEQRYALILKEFTKMFKPLALLTSAAQVMAQVQVEGDARAFLVEHVARLDGQRISALKRPIHLFGLRFFLPPFVVKTQPRKGQRKTKNDSASGTATDWQVEVKVESLMEDPTKLYLEASAQWPAEMKRQWNEATITQAVNRLQTVKTFLEDRVVEFLRDGPSKAEESK